MSPERAAATGPIDEHQESAVRAGLRYVSDTMPGIRRVGSGDGVRYLGPDGKAVRDGPNLERIRRLVIPPAWTEVWICPLAEGHIQVTARDGRGRKQYRYHPRYRAVRDETKFSRLLEFSELLPGIRDRLERDLRRAGLDRRKIMATVVWLLERTCIRIGNEEYARENKSYGLTTMRRRHVVIRGAKLDFEFRGKSGVRHTHSITDRRIARIVQHCQSLPGQELFKYLDDDGRRQTVDSGDINDYLRDISGSEVTAKDFRTWAGTMLAGVALSRLGPASTEKETRANVVKAIDEVARRLGNTRAVCRAYYVHPAVLEAYSEGVVALPAVPDNGKRVYPAAALRKEETAVLALIQSRKRREDPPAG